MRYYTLKEWKRRKNAGLGENDYELEQSDLSRAFDEMLKTPGIIPGVIVKKGIIKSILENIENAE
jgi:hypothetical protein